MKTLTEIDKREISVLEPSVEAYMGQGTGMFVSGIGQVIIIAADQNKVMDVFDRLAPDCDINLAAVRPVAMISAEKIKR